jgi:hypothetical protein
MWSVSSDFAVFTRKTHNYSKFCFYREFEGVVNKAICIFGPDNESKGNFDFKKEIEEINSLQWSGRSWTYSGFNVGLEINKGTDKFNLVIGPF